VGGLGCGCLSFGDSAEAGMKLFWGGVWDVWNGVLTEDYSELRAVILDCSCAHEKSSTY